MRSTKIATCFMFMAMATAFASGCSARDDGGEASEGKLASVTLGEFKLYREAGHVPTPLCDVHTFLKLSQSDEGPRASLEERLDGVCELAVLQQPREYALAVKDGACGTKIYEGVVDSDDPGSAGDALTVYDYRQATCVRVVSDVVVEERRGGSLSTTYALRGGSTGAVTTKVTGTITFDGVPSEGSGDVISGSGTVKLLDVSALDAPSVTIASQAVSYIGSGPIAFETPVPEVNASSSYVVYVHLDADQDGAVSRGDYVTTESFPVLTQGHGTDVAVRVKRIP